MLTPRNIANQQLVAYNNRDIDAFCALFSDDITLIDLPSMSVFVNGLVELKAFYTQRFSNTELQCVVHSHSDIANWAIDKETVHGLSSGPLDIVAMYEVADEKIKRAFFIKD